MFELIIYVLSCWLLLTVCKLLLKIAWGAAKVIALLLSVLTIPILIGGVGCIDGSWETDQECGICGKEVTIVCH